MVIAALLVCPPVCVFLCRDVLFLAAAAVARKVYLRPGRGVGGLSKAFGTKARRGTMTNTHKPAATGIIRHVLQQLEALKVRREALTKKSCETDGSTLFLQRKLSIYAEENSNQGPTESRTYEIACAHLVSFRELWPVYVCVKPCSWVARYFPCYICVGRL